jgi:pilus assembly protein CpaB
VTLAVTPPDGERIALASSEGRISLALRNPMDVAPTETPGIRVTTLMHGTAPEPAPPPRKAPVARAQRAVTPAPSPAPVAPAIYTVETIRAAKRTQEVVR